MRVASYWASLGFRVDQKELRKVDSTLKKLENKLKNFGRATNKHLKINLDIGKFTIDQKRLDRALGDALDAASPKVAFEVSRFVVNDRNLLAALLRAARRLPPLPPGPTPPPGPNPNPPRRDYIGAGGVAGFAARAYMPALALVGGGYGLAWSNKRNQEVVAARMQTEAVQQAYGGTKEQGTQTFEWLKSEADRIGFSYMDAAPDFNNLMSNLMGAGGSSEDAKTVFSGFAEYGRVNKLSNARQQLVFNALGQVAGKDKLQAEELTKQLGNSLPGAKSIFAEAYQRQTGGRLQGGEAIQALEAAMKKGLVRGDILKYAAQVASEMAKPGLTAAQQASQAEQNRARNERDNLVGKASEAGLEKGWARIWKSLTIAMKESVPLVESLGRGFNELSKYASFAILLPQSFKRAFEGRDSWVADQLGAKNIQLIKDWYGGISDINTEIKTLLGTAVEGWRLYFQEFGDEWLALLTGIQGVLLYSLKAINAALAGEGGKAADYMAAAVASATGKSREEAEAIANGVSPPMGVGEVATGVKDVLSYTPVGYVADKYMSGYEWLGEKIGVTSWAKLFGGLMDKGLSDGDRASIDYQREMAMSREQFKASQNNQVNINSGAIVINANTSDPEALSEVLMSKLKDQSNYLITGQYTEALVHFPEGG